MPGLDILDRLQRPGADRRTLADIPVLIWVSKRIDDFASSDHAKASPEPTTFGYFKLPPQGPFQKATQHYRPD